MAPLSPPVRAPRRGGGAVRGCGRRRRGRTRVASARRQVRGLCRGCAAGRHRSSWPGAPSERSLCRRPRRWRPAGGGRGRRAERGRRGARGVGTRGGGAAPRRRAGIPGPRRPRPPRPPQSRPRRSAASLRASASPRARPRLPERVPTPPARPGSRHPPSPPLDWSPNPLTGAGCRLLPRLTARGCAWSRPHIRRGPRPPLPHPGLVPVPTLGKARERPRARIGPPGAAGWCCHGNRMACEAVRGSDPFTGAPSGPGELIWGGGRSRGSTGWGAPGARGCAESFLQAELHQRRRQSLGSGRVRS